MKIELEALGNQKFRVRGELDADTLRRERNRRARAYAPLVHLKGFRPGHVPIELVARQIGPVLDDEARESAARQAIADVLKERSLSLTFDPDIQYGEAGADGTVSFTAEFETLPTLDPKDYLGVEVPDFTLPPVGEDDVEAGLKRLRESAATYQERPADSVAHEGDMATCELTLRDADTGEALGEPQTLHLEVGLADEPLPDIGRELLGMKVGEDRSFSRTILTKDDSGEEATRKVEATVKVETVMEKVLPALDDDFARRYGGTETLDAWKDRLRAHLEKKRQETLREMRADAVVSAILQANPIEVGEETVRRLAAVTELQVKERLMPGLSAEQRDQIPLGIDPERMQSFARDRLVRNLLLDAIAKREGVEAAPEDLERRLEELAQELDVPLPKLRVAVSPEVLDRLRSQIRHDKTLDMLVRYAVVKPRVVETGMMPPDQADPSLVAGGEGRAGHRDAVRPDEVTP